MHRSWQSEGTAERNAYCFLRKQRSSETVSAGCHRVWKDYGVVFPTITKEAESKSNHTWTICHMITSPGYTQAAGTGYSGWNMFKTDKGLTAYREVHFLKLACLLHTWLGLKSLCPWWGDKTHSQRMARKQVIGNQKHLPQGFNQGLAIGLPPGLTGTLKSSKGK